ncbi:cytochrome c-type biogenesis protein [Aureimonas populi]|uniref:Cytochrome c-type biogenesis protein n=1 Tax=Aureimonas populi TaxID=1701758 RepID=A0ABW5CM38_9HYPH|nr:cytochrome c-type biogenesis protein [Aureimonas populi]
MRAGLALLALLALLCLPVPAALAVQPDEVLADPALEARARQLSAELRCMVCQNQSIDDSDAPLARDLRLLVRERLVAGDSDEDVVDYLVARYGEFVLLRPRFGPQTLALWGLPVLILIGGGAYLLLRSRNAPPRPPAVLTAEEERAVDALLRKGPPERESL